MGIYELQEVETLDGLVLNETKYEVKFTQKDTETKIYTETKEIINDTTIVEISKTTITGDKELSGAELSVIDENGNIIDTWISTDKTHTIEGLTAGKEYILRENLAPLGYAKSTDIKFKVTNTSEVQKVVMVDKMVLVSKTDLVTGQELPGADLMITDKDGNVVDEWISSDEPHYVVGLEEGQEYTLTEKTTPYGYEIAESIIFTVTYDKETQKIEMKDMPIFKTVKVVKIDSETKETIKSKFVFGIYEDEECTKLVKEVKSNKEEGTVTFEELRYGNYYIKEIEAPKGYMLSDRIVKVEINDKGVFIDGENIEEKDSTYSFTYENDLIPKIQTGSDFNFILLFSLIGISIVGIIAGVLILKSKSNKKK